jgi:hypothetical protein
MVKTRVLGESEIGRIWREILEIDGRIEMREKKRSICNKFDKKR